MVRERFCESQHRHNGFEGPVLGPITLPLSATIGEAVNIMIERDFRHIPITEDGGERPLAVFSIKDVIDLLAQSFPTHVLNLPPRPHQEMSTREGA